MSGTSYLATARLNQLGIEKPRAPYLWAALTFAGGAVVVGFKAFTRGWLW